MASTRCHARLVQDREGREALARVVVANDGEVIARLRLSAAEAARVCGVTPRQLIYWTKKGLVRPSPENDRDYDVFALEKAIRIRQALEKGHSLERAAQIVQRDLDQMNATVERIASLGGAELETELRRSLEDLEERIAQIRRMLPAGLGVARLRRAVALIARLEQDGQLQRAGADSESAKAVTLRLGRAVEELEQLVREASAAPA